MERKKTFLLFPLLSPFLFLFLFLLSKPFFLATSHRARSNMEARKTRIFFLSDASQNYLSIPYFGVIFLRLFPFFLRLFPSSFSFFSFFGHYIVCFFVLKKKERRRRPKIEGEANGTQVFLCSD